MLLLCAQDAGTVVAINKDAGAPIFNCCDLGVVADANETVAEMLRLLGEEGDSSAAPPPTPAA